MNIERRTRIRLLLSFWLFVLSAVAYLDRTNISIAGLQISSYYGLGNQRLGWIASAFLIAYAAFQVPAGWASARFGPRRVLTYGVLWWGVVTALTALLPPTLAHAALILVCLRFFLGIGEAVMYPASNQFVMRWIPEKERGFINGLIFAGVGAGSGLTPPLLTWLIINHGWRSAFWFSAAVGLAAGIIWWVIARDSPEEHPWVSAQELREIRPDSDLSPAAAGAPVVETQPAKSPASKISWSLILRRRDLLSLMGAYFGFLYVVWIYFSWFFIYMVQVRGFDLKSSARYSTLPFLSMTIGCLIGGKLTDILTRKYGLRVGRCGLAAAASLLTALFLVVGSQVSSPQLAGVILAGGAGALYLSQSSYWSAAIDIAGPSSGVFSSIINMGGQIGGAITASLTPWIAARFGWTTSFGTAAALAVVSAILWMSVHPERPLSSDARDSQRRPDSENKKVRSQEPAAI